MTKREKTLSNALKRVGRERAKVWEKYCKLCAKETKIELQLRDIHQAADRTR